MSDTWSPDDVEPQAGYKDSKLGQILLTMKLVTKSQLDVALSQQSVLNETTKDGHHYKLGEVLLFKKVLSLDQLHNALRQQTHKARMSRTIQSNIPVSGKRLK